MIVSPTAALMSSRRVDVLDPFKSSSDLTNERKQFASYQAKDGKITAVMSMQRDPIVAKASELMRLDIMPSLAELKAGKACFVEANDEKGGTLMIGLQNILDIDLIKA